MYSVKSTDSGVVHEHILPFPNPHLILFLSWINSRKTGATLEGVNSTASHSSLAPFFVLLSLSRWLCLSPFFSKDDENEEKGSEGTSISTSTEVTVPPGVTYPLE